MTNFPHQTKLTVPAHRKGIGTGASNSVLIPKEYGRIAEWVNKHIRSEHGSLGGWPLYDYIVDDDWAETGLAEGTVINQYTGTKIFSTVQGAVTDATDITEASIWVCSGIYDEAVVVADKYLVVEAPNASLWGELEVRVTSFSFTGDCLFTARGLGIDEVLWSNGSLNILLDKCTVYDKLGCPDAEVTVDINTSAYETCDLDHLEVSGGECFLSDCAVRGLYVREALQQLTVSGGSVTGAWSSYAEDVFGDWDTTDSRHWPTRDGAGKMWESCVLIGADCSTLSFSGVNLEIATTGSKPDYCSFILFVDDWDDHVLSCRDVALTGCTVIGGQTGKPVYLVNNISAHPVARVGVEGNVYNPVGTDGGIDGAYTDSTFGPNTPDDIDYSGITGTGNVIYQGGAGAGSTNDEAYVRVDGTHPLTADWDPGAHRIGNLTDFWLHTSELYIGDANFYDYYDSGGGEASRIYDQNTGPPATFDYMVYNRAADAWKWYIASVDVFEIAAAGIKVNHILELTATHGVDIEGITHLDSFEELTEIAKPANPAANKLRVYAKDDGAGVTKLYGLDSAGTETAYGAGVGATDILSERATQAIAAGTTVSVTDGAPLTPFTTTGNITSTAAPFIAAGREGQLVILRNDNGSGTLTISDTNIGAGGSLLRLSANTLTMAAGSSLALAYSSIQAAWVEQWYLALVAVTPSINTHTINIGAGASNSQNAEVANAGTDTPTFAWTFTGVPSSGTVDVSAGGDAGADYPHAIAAPYTSLTSDAFNKGTAVGDVRTFTPSIVVNGTTLTTPTATITYINRRYMGPSAQTTTLTTAQILGLDADAHGTSGLSTSATGTFSVNIEAGEYLWYAFRSTLRATLYLTLGGEIAAFIQKQTDVDHTNDSGFVEHFDTWRATTAAVGAVSAVVAASEGTNRFYMGPSTDTDPISNANILALDDTADGESGLYSSQARTWTTIKIEAGEYLWYCHPDRVADLSTIKDGTTGFAIAGSYRTNVSHTNQYGYVEDYRCWRSDNTGIYPSGENVVVT